MCLANIYSDADNRLLMSSTSSIRVEDGKLILRDLFGTRREVLGSIKNIDLENSVVIVHEEKD